MSQVPWYHCALNVKSVVYVKSTSQARVHVAKDEKYLPRGTNGTVTVVSYLVKVCQIPRREFRKDRGTTPIFPLWLTHALPLARTVHRIPSRVHTLSLCLSCSPYRPRYIPNKPRYIANKSTGITGINHSSSSPSLFKGKSKQNYCVCV